MILAQLGKYPDNGEGTLAARVTMASKPNKTPSQEDLELQSAKLKFGNEAFTSQQLAQLLGVNLRTAQRRIKKWLNNSDPDRLYLMVGGQEQYTFDPNKLQQSQSVGLQRFQKFREESAWKPVDLRNAPAFGHPAKKKQDNTFWPYQVSSATAFGSPDYREFFQSKYQKTFSDEIARRDLKAAIENQKLSKVGSNDARTYAIVDKEGDPNYPGYNSYVVPLNPPPR